MTLHRMTFSVEGDIDTDRYVFAAFGLLIHASNTTPLPHVRLTFKGPAHPFVRAVRATTDDVQQDYLALAPVQDEHVYLMPTWANNFITETATHLLVFLDGSLLETSVLQDGRDMQKVEAVQWEGPDIYRKKLAQRILLKREEGGSARVELERRANENLWARANCQLAEWATTAPDGGDHFHQISFTVDYGSPWGKYSNCYPLKREDTEIANLGKYIRSYIEPRSGRFRIPVAPYTLDYSSEETLRQIKKHQTWLAQVLGMKSNEYKKLLEHYEIWDDSSVEPD